MNNESKLKRSYYSEIRQKFLDEENESILGKLLQNDPYSTLSTQKNAWKSQIEKLMHVIGSV